MTIKNTPVKKILAIDPGTREMGIAVLHGNELEHYAVKTITNRESPSAILLQGSQIVYKLISTHQPGMLAIERPFIGYGNRSATLVDLAREISKLGKGLGLDVKEINPSTVKKAVAGSGSATKRDVARVLSARFPELRVHLEQAPKYKEGYWNNMFDAVAVAVTAAGVY